MSSVAYCDERLTFLNGVLSDVKSERESLLLALRSELLLNPKIKNAVLADLKLIAQSLQEGDVTKAEHQIAAHRKRFPNCLELDLLEATLCVKTGKVREADFLYSKLQSDDFLQIEDKVHWAMCLIELGDLANAVKLLEGVLKLHPKNPYAWGTMGMYWRKKGNKHKALECLEQAVKISNNHIPTLTNFAVTADEVCRFDDAISAYSQVVKLDPANENALLGLGNSLESVLRYDKATAVLKTGHELQGEIRHEFSMALGGLARYSGDRKLAKKWLKTSIDEKPENMKAYFNLSQFDPSAIDLDQLAKTYKRINPDDTALYYFTRFNIHAHEKRYDEAFSDLKTGNDIEDRKYEAAWARLLKRSEHVEASAIEIGKKKFTVEAVKEPHPIFIVGTPRSGSTLLEQILCNHTCIEAAGELALFSQAMVKAQINGQIDYHQLSRVADLYMKTLKPLKLSSKYFVDKMPNNSLLATQILATFPNAKMINLVRRPADAIWSMYKMRFANPAGHPYMFSMKKLVEFYSLYRKSIEQIPSHLKGRLLTLSYEDLVRSPKENINKALEFLGLPLEDAVENFEGSKGIVRTASVDQVRGGIYKKKKPDWHNYVNFLSEDLKLDDEVLFKV